MNENKIKALIKAIDRLLGDPLQADAREIESLFAEFGEGRNPAQSPHSIAGRRQRPTASCVWVDGEAFAFPL